MQITQDQLLAELQRHVGKANGIHVNALARNLTNQTEDIDMHARRVRSLVQEMRESGHQICATPAGGYFMAETPEELDETCVFLHARLMTTLTQICRMKNVPVPDLRSQLQLPA